MIDRTRLGYLGAVLASTALLAGCAHPSPGNNEAAAAVQAPPNVPLATKPSAGQEVKAVANDQIDITFPHGGSALTQEADKKLDLAARLFRDANPVLMFTTGYSDNTGDEYANLLLSARRAEVVKKALVARGIPANRLLLQALGASDPADAADPAAAANRRVVVTWRLI
ncbi:OmpA family protein [Lichenicola sp.]|uniref:OmpA family protein n=1 Tax=Lichenicola sp. TaxID=2804529 RepID=UPI003AFF7EEE